MKTRIALSEEGEEIIIKDITVQKHTTYGYFSPNDLKKKAGTIIKTNTGKPFIILDADFKDMHSRIKRHAQVITTKDIGMIIAETGITKTSTVIDAGTGSGALCCFLAAVAKKVTSYDKDARSIEAGTTNKKALNLKNLIIKEADVTQPNAITEKNVDVIILDLPEPWNALDNAVSALRPGGRLVCYSPHTTQTLETVNMAKIKGLIVTRSIELIQREWIFEGKKARPDFKGLGHTGFLTFFRKRS